MPTYQYRCNACDHEFEEFQSMTDDAIEICPECQGETRRLISGGAGLLFRGSGFYQTDYRSSKYQADKAKDSSSASPSASSSSSTKSSEAKKSKPKD